jgi:phosphoglycerol transferase MdoB-like AlkP superfamily enzyme
MGAGLNCTQGYANGLHSAEGIPAVTAGIPTLMPEAFSTSIYGTNAITTLPNLLKAKGYSTAFFHGGTNGTMSFDIFSAAAGYAQYFGRTEYGNDADYDGAWGIPDGPFLQYFAGSLGRLKSPFCASVFTLSSHPPYTLPSSYKTPLPPNTSAVHKAVAYTDDALRRFFETAATAPWYSNTLFVITADHASPDNFTSHYSSGIGEYAIPLVLYAPGDAGLRGTLDAPVQQIDIMPSVLNYLGYDRPFFAFGKSLFDSSAQRFVVTENNGAYQWIDGSGYVLRATESRATGLFRFPADSSLQQNILPQSRAAGDSVMRRLKAFVQVYRNALIQNKMRYER